jgi:transcriptional/translational regulatory protein YebC/TACO1
MQVQSALTSANLTPSVAEMTMLPKTVVEVDLETGKRIARLMEALDEHDDVQNVYCNANITAEMME